MRFVLVVACITSAVVACRSSDNASDDGPPVDAPIDGPDGVGCTTTTPRTAEPQVFVGPTGLEDRLDALIDGAQTSIDLQMYLFNDHTIADHLVTAFGRGVKIRIILDPDEAGNAAVKPALMNAGIPTVDASAIYVFSHAKYMVIDHSKAVIMSMNFNVDAMSKERNYGMVDTDLEDIADVQSVFDQDFALAQGQSPKPPNLDCTRLIISPNNAKLRLAQFIAGVHTTLDVEALYVTDVGIRTAMGMAKQRGATVRVILEDPSDQSENTDATTYFTSVGIPVKYAEAQFYLHAKMIIGDGVAFVGSQNFSASGLGTNREMGALVFEPDQVATIQTQYESDWTATTPAN
jgi:phosphatidylserine/phosphatidylglycerophosphate/cardiolipin synthase-like enzyme